MGESHEQQTHIYPEIKRNDRWPLEIQEGVLSLVFFI